MSLLLHNLIIPLFYRHYKKDLKDKKTDKTTDTKKSKYLSSV